MDNTLQGAVWVDVNTRFRINPLPDRLPDAAAIVYGSLYNLFNCPVGTRGRIFEPTYGAALYEFLQEPISETTSTGIKMALIQSLATWEPRIQLITGQCSVIPDQNLPGYKVRLVFKILQGSDTSPKSVSFTLSKV